MTAHVEVSLPEAAARILAAAVPDGLLYLTFRAESAALLPRTSSNRRPQPTLATLPHATNKLRAWTSTTSPNIIRAASNLQATAAVRADAETGDKLVRGFVSHDAIMPRSQASSGPGVTGSLRSSTLRPCDRGAG